MLDWKRSGLGRGAVLALAAVLMAGLGCFQELPRSGAQLYSSPQTNPILVSEDGRHLLVANTTSGTVSVYNTRRLVLFGRVLPRFALLAEIPVGHDPVGLAQRPGSDQFWVANHISDTISVIDLHYLDVVDTIQERDADGIPTTDAPVAIAFSSPTRAFVTLDDRNEVLVIDTQPDGSDPVVTDRLHVTAQAPRALATMDGKVYVAAFESENQTEFPTCNPFDTRLPIWGGPGVDEAAVNDQGCAFATQVIGEVNVSLSGSLGIALGFDTFGDFAAVNPNIGGSVIVDRYRNEEDRGRPDRDLFVYDAATLALDQVVEHLGTLLYGVEAQAGRVWITQTDARNHLDGLAALDNRMFDNRLAWMDCNGACGIPNIVDLEANPFGVPVPTPYGIRVSADGRTLVASVAGSDGIPGTVSNPGVSIPGLITLDAEGNVLGHVQTGAIPQGVALKSDRHGEARTAYVLNTVDSSVSVVDVRDPSHPHVIGTFEVGDDPTPPQIAHGRAMFMSARASSKGTFSCESCHPNGNIDQILWTINAVEGPGEVEGCSYPDDYDPALGFAGDCPEPRATMPIRGLRDTLPLHWAGSLADPFDNLPAQLIQPEDAGAPDCNLAVDGEAGCARHLADASLSGVMCDQIPFCAPGPTGLDGALNDAERDALAAFMVAGVSFPPSPRRRSDDALSAQALQGVQDFFTDEDGLGVGSPGGIGQVVGFAPITCADNSGGCHTLPLTNGTNSLTVGSFDSPSMRGLWDRYILFSNGNTSSQEWLEFAQQCADGTIPWEDLGHTGVSVQGVPLPDPVAAGNILTGDPCALRSPLGGGILNLDPFDGVPSGETIYDYDVGMTERGQFMGTFESIFQLVYGVRGAPMWEFFNEMSVGLTGLVGRQLSLTPDNFQDADLIAEMDLLEQYAEQGRITAVARNRFLGEFRFNQGRWRPQHRGPAFTGEELRGRAALFNAVYTLTADLPAAVSIAGEDRQPLLDIDPDDKLEEMTQKVENDVNLRLAIPEVWIFGGTIRLGARYVHPHASVIVDGALCEACDLTALSAPTSGEPAVDVVVDLDLTPGPHVVQVLNPNGWMSNEMPLMVREPIR